VLTSELSLSREVVQNQQRAMTVLVAKRIPYETVNGADPSQKARYVMYLDWFCVVLCLFRVPSN
jgi:hypothetical protein